MDIFSKFGGFRDHASSNGEISMKTDVEFVEKIPHFFNCPGCHKIFKQCCTTSCFHKICKECIEGQLAREIGGGECPTCQKPLDKNYASDPWIDGQINLLSTYCPNRKTGCNWKGPFGDLNGHTSVSCEFRVSKCQNEGCSFLAMQKTLFEHHKICKERKVHCEYCHLSMTFAAREIHVASTCEKKLIQCTHCSEKYPRGELQSHVVKVCPMAPITCSFGCSETIRRKNMGSHLKKNLISHFTYLLNRNLTLENNLLDTNKTIHAMRSDIHDLCSQKRDHNLLILKDGVNIGCEYPQDISWIVPPFGVDGVKNGQLFVSPSFYVNGIKLQLHVYPAGRDKNDTFSYFLHAVQLKNQTSFDFKIYHEGCETTPIDKECQIVFRHAHEEYGWRNVLLKEGLPEGLQIRCQISNIVITNISCSEK